MGSFRSEAGYPDVCMLIGGRWRQATDGNVKPVLNPATEEVIGHVPVATSVDLDEALASSEQGFLVWRQTPPHTRYQCMRRAAQELARRTDEIARLMTLEQGKTLAEARAEITNVVDAIDWFAEEARRLTNTIIPARVENVEQRVLRQPIGPVAAFTPWNFPVSQAARKICAALATGCSMILKGPEDTPASCAAMVAAFADAGLPAGVLNLVYGEPAAISNYLISSPVIRKISFTGSTSVGKQLAALAGTHMKPATMELGGHGPVLIFEDADIARAVTILVGAKFRNAGQVCTSPTRFIVHRKVREPFVAAFVAATKAIQVGNGMDSSTQMGPLTHAGRLAAMESLVADAVAAGARLETGGMRIGNRGYFFAPTILLDTPHSARIMNEEPFGPIALINSYEDDEAMIAEANRLPYGLAGYAYTGRHSHVHMLGQRLNTGMVSINHHNLALPEVPFGGVRDSGYGNEGGAEALDAYLVHKYVSAYTPD